MESKESEEREKEKRKRERGARNGERGLSISKVMMIMMMMIVMIVMRGRLKSLGRRKSFALQRFEPEHCTSSDDQEGRMDDDGLQ